MKTEHLMLIIAGVGLYLMWKQMQQAKAAAPTTVYSPQQMPSPATQKQQAVDPGWQLAQQGVKTFGDIFTSIVGAVDKSQSTATQPSLAQRAEMAFTGL